MVHDNTENVQYLGIYMLTNDLKWNSHVNNISRKASMTLGFLKRNLLACRHDINSLVTKTNIAEFANSVDLDEVA